MLQTAIGVVTFLPGAVLAGIALYLLTLAVASVGYRPRPLEPGGHFLDLAVVVPAHDEEQLIARCVRALANQTYPAHLRRVVVVADNCSDATASVAAQSGAEVMVRDRRDLPGKGRALRWAMDILLAEPVPPDAIVVVDADSEVAPDFLAAIAAELISGSDVVQADYELLVEPGHPAPLFVEAGFLLFHRVRLLGRARLGMAANLVGNGMAFSRRVLERVPWTAFTGVEDLEQSIQLRLAGVRPTFAPQARVWGPGAASRHGAVRQRMRWEGGRFHLMRRRLVELVSAAVEARDPRLLDAAIDLATPPLALLTILVGTGAILGVALALAGASAWWGVIPWLVAAIAVPAFVVIGLRSAGAPPRTFRVLLAGPVFVAWKIATYLRLLRGHDVSGWERTDRVTS